MPLAWASWPNGYIPNSDPPKVVIKSVNPEYQAYERIAEEVNVVGRVVWAARRL